jgi:hypothetical protein
VEVKKKAVADFPRLQFPKEAATTRSHTKKAEVTGGLDMRDEPIELTYAIM